MFDLIYYLLYLFLLIPILYLFAFALFSKLPSSKKQLQNATSNKFAIIFPAYKEDEVIINSINKFIKQDYNPKDYDVYVASDSMLDATNNLLKELGVNIIIIKEDISSKAKALKKCMSYINGNYDGIIILDADNIVKSDFLTQVNKYFDSKNVLQLHRTSKNNDNNISMLDSISEEINNSIFRKGHINIGFPAALIGSGIVFPYLWFKENVNKLNTFAEDKELELLLICDNVNIDYIEDIYVYDEKINSINSYSKQRQRWINTQYQLLKESIHLLSFASISKNIFLINKLFQWIIPPRLILFGMNIILSIIFLYVLDFQQGWIWVINLLLIFFITILSLPLKLLKDKRLYLSLLKLPQLFFITVKNMFLLKLRMTEFGATKHNNIK